MNTRTLMIAAISALVICLVGATTAHAFGLIPSPTRSNKEMSAQSIPANTPHTTTTAVTIDPGFVDSPKPSSVMLAQAGDPGLLGAVAVNNQPSWSDGNNGEFAVEPGGQLPSDAECKKRVTKTSESRPGNNKANHSVPSSLSLSSSAWGMGASSYIKRVSGNYTGTTDEIIQWAACKWGFEIDTVRAQAIVESNWRQTATAGPTSDPAKCPAGSRITNPAPAGQTTSTMPAAPLPAVPLTTLSLSPIGDTSTNTTTVATTAPAPVQSPGSTTTTTAPILCYTAFGILQVRSDYQPGTFPWSRDSTAFNLDYSLGMKRACYDGIGWLGAKTRADAWGCVGVHYSGSWHDPAANEYIQKVKTNYVSKPWKSF